MEVKPSRILVVDDGKVARMLTSRQLANEGHDVTEATSGEEALEFLGIKEFDVMILDVLMPGLSGMETLAKLRENYTDDELPVIMATAQDQVDTMTEAFEKGANDYITKPVMFPILRARLNTQLRLVQALREIERLKNSGS